MKKEYIAKVKRAQRKGKGKGKKTQPTEAASAAAAASTPATSSGPLLVKLLCPR
jgi:hypothetical protein